MPDETIAHLFCLSHDEWECSRCGDVKYIQTAEDSGHRFPNYCDNCGAPFGYPVFKARAKHGWFYDPDVRRLVKPTQTPGKRTRAGHCPDCGYPVDPVEGGASPHVRSCPCCGDYYRGCKGNR